MEPVIKGIISECNAFEIPRNPSKTIGKEPAISIQMDNLYFFLKKNISYIHEPKNKKLCIPRQRKQSGKLIVNPNRSTVSPWWHNKA